MKFLVEYDAFDTARLAGGAVLAEEGQNNAAGSNPELTVLLPSIRQGYTSARFLAGTHSLVLRFDWAHPITIDSLGVFGLKVVGAAYTDGEQTLIRSLPVKPAGSATLRHSDSRTLIASRNLTWRKERSAQTNRGSDFGVVDPVENVILWASQVWFTFASVTADRFDLRLRLNNYPSTFSPEGWRFFVGRVIAGEAWTPSRNPDDGWRLTRQDPLRLNESEGAYVASHRYASYRTLFASWTGIRETLKDELEDLAFPGKASPLVVSVDESDKNTFYGRVMHTDAEARLSGSYDVEAIYQEISRG